MPGFLITQGLSPMTEFGTVESCLQRIFIHEFWQEHEKKK